MKERKNTYKMLRRIFFSVVKIVLRYEKLELSLRQDQVQMDSWSTFREVNRFEDFDSILRGEFKNLRSLCGSRGIIFSSTLPVKSGQCGSASRRQISPYIKKGEMFTEDKTLFLHRHLSWQNGVSCVCFFSKVAKQKSIR